MLVERIDTPVEIVHGESPHWDVEEECLYFTDVFGAKSLHRYKPSTGEHYKVVVDFCPHFIMPIVGQKGKFLVPSGTKINVVEWDGKSDKLTSITEIAEVDDHPDLKGNRINDAKCDPKGRIWFGTLGPDDKEHLAVPHRGTIYSMEPNGEVKAHVDRISISNGIAWNSTHTKMYYNDTAIFTVDEFDFDLERGTISNRRPIFSLKKHGIDGFADGMTADTDGNLFVAVFGGSKVLKIDPRKAETLLETIEFPARQVTSAGFGGSNLDELYVTTSKWNLLGTGDLEGPVDGSLYKVSSLGVKGSPQLGARCTKAT